MWFGRNTKVPRIRKCGGTVCWLINNYKVTNECVGKNVQGRKTTPAPTRPTPKNLGKEIVKIGFRAAVMGY